MLNEILISIFIAFFLVSLYMYSKKEHKLREGKKKDFEIVITSLNEDESIVIETLSSWLKTGKELYLLRDGPTTKRLLDFLSKNNITLIVTKKDGKAGAINNYVENYAKKEFFFLVDVDEKLVNLENLEKCSKVEGDVVISKKQFTETSYKARIFNLTNGIFKTIQEFSNREGRALFNGSCAFISKETVLSVKFRNLKIEDIDFSIRAFNSNKTFYYVDKVIAEGKEPSLYSFLSQHARYSYGNGELVRKNIEIIKKDLKLSLILLFLPLLSLFQTFVIFYSLISLDLTPFFVEMILSPITYYLYLRDRNPLSFLIVFSLNFIVLPPIRTYNFFLGLLNTPKNFSTTL